MIADLFIKILNLSIGAVPIMAALLVLRLLFKKAVPRKVFYIAWALVFLRLMVPFSLESNFSFFNFMPRAEVVEENIGTSVIFIENSGTKVDFPVLNHPSADNPNTDAPALTKPNTEPEKPSVPVVSVAKIDKNQILGTVWIFGTAGLLLFGIIGYFAVLRKTKFESVPYSEDISLSDFFKTPIVCGLIRPKIILPMNFDLDDEARVASVIAHECTHIRRKDNLWRLLGSFVLYVHWFNPLVWICYNAFIRDMEVSCDEEVLSKSKNDIRAEYAESLVSLSGSGTNPLYGGVLSFGESGIKERVKCIMSFKKATVFIIILCVAAIAALGVIFLTNPGISHEPEEVYFEVTGGDDISFSKENGLEINLSFTNTDDRTLWLSSDITVDRSKDGKGYTERFESPYGTVMVEPGKTVVFCDKVPAEYCLNEPVYGEWVIARSVFIDEELEDSRSATFSFEVEEDVKLKTAEAILAVAKENPNLLDVIENPSDAELRDLKYYTAKNPEIPEAVVEFFYLYNSAFVTFEVPDFSSIDNGKETFDILEQYLKYEVAKERLESAGDYVTDFEIEIERYSGDSNKFVYSHLWNFKTKSGREPGGRDYWEFTLSKNPDSGEYQISDFEWADINGYGGLYPGLKNVFEDIARRYAPGHENDYSIIANIGIVEVLIDNGFFETSSEEPETPGFSGKIVSGSTAKDYIPNGFPEEEVLGDANMAEYFRILLKSICSGTTKLKSGGITFVMQPSDENIVKAMDADGAGLLMKYVEEINIINVEPLPNPSTGGLIEIYFETEGEIYKIAYDGRLVLSQRSGEYAYVFDGEVCYDIFFEIRNFAEEKLSGAKEYVEKTEEETHPAQSDNTDSDPDEEPFEGSRPISTDEYFMLQANLFRNSDKTYIPSAETERIVGFFEAYDWREAKDKSVLGNPATGVDVLELSRERDGKKYTIELYEKGFVLSGSAVREEYNRKAWFCEGNAWDSLIADMNSEYSEASELYPYWFGLINIKNVSVVSVKAMHNENGKTVGDSNNSFTSEDDCMGEFIERLRSIKISGSEKITNTMREEILDKEDKFIYALIIFENGTSYEVHFTDKDILIYSSGVTYNLRHTAVEGVDPYDDFLDFSEEGGPANPMTGKPVIYLYPEKETEVSVNLDFDGRLTYTYPAINNGWRVLAKPDGTLTNLADGSTHYYLFWEGTARPKWTYEKGFVVKGSETENFLRENLAKMGLTPREYNDFITYWVPKMQENKYNLISFSGAEYSEIAKLTVNPKPDSVIRIHMVWKALDKPIEIEPQVLPTFERKGFTLVEWGGTEVFE